MGVLNYTDAPVLFETPTYKRPRKHKDLILVPGTNIRGIAQIIF